METVKLKTNITCSNCLSKVTPYLDKAVGEDNWDVDLQDPDKTLTVIGGGNEREEASKAVADAGYEAKVKG